MIEKNSKDWIVKNVKLFVLICLLSAGCGEQSAVVSGKKPSLVLISTKFGDMKVKLYDDTPIHRDNFLKLVKEGTYDQNLFHRVIKGFMIQGGDPNSKGAGKDVRLGSGGPGYTLEAELFPNHIHKKGALAAARQGDNVNPEKRSSGSQFYIVQGKTFTEAGIKSSMQRRKSRDPNVVEYSEEQLIEYQTIGGTPQLDGGYTVFGEVIEGMAVIDSIAAVKTLRGDRPVEDVMMEMKIVKK